jgi:hypothetical protein
MKYTIEIDGFLETPAVQKISMSDVIELRDKSSELSQLSVTEFGDEILMQGSVTGISIDSEYSLSVKSETGDSILHGSNFPTAILPVSLNLEPSHFYHYEYRISDGMACFEVECETFDVQKLVLHVSEVLFPEGISVPQCSLPQGKLMIITGIEYEGRVIEGDCDWTDYGEVWKFITVNECGKLLSLNDTKIGEGGGADGDEVM